MTEVSNTNNTININLDSTLGISDTEATNLVQKLNNEIVGKDGIESISYANGQLEVKGANISADALADKLQGLAFSSEEMKAFLGEEVKSFSFKTNSDGTITMTTNGVSQSSKPITDFDIRELMKLLISAFSELMTADRERALNILTATVAALETKISALETAKEEQFKSAMSQAIGSIVSGVASITIAGIGAGLAAVGPKTKNVPGFGSDNSSSAITGTQMTGTGIWSDLLNASAMPLGKIIDGSAGVASAIYSANKTEEDIKATKADALLEILRTAQEQYRKGSDSLQQFVDKVLSVMQQLLQSAAQTEKAVANI